MELECERSGTLYGQYQSQGDIVKRIRRDIYNWAVVYRFTDITFYDGFRHVIEQDQASEIYNLNELADTGETEFQIRNTMFSVHQKCMDNVGEFTNIEKRVLTTGLILSKIKATPPLPDTLGLPEPIRYDICVKLLSDSANGRTSDWTALASQLGKIYNIVSL